jgi:XTP/dITP diphosphohydrolase
MTVAIASKNLGKMQEFKYLFQQFLPHLTDIQLAGLKEFPEMGPITEDGITFHQNARKKALLTAEHTGLLSIADDSGLEVDALENAPGIYSARFAGEHATDEENMQKLLAHLKNVPPYRRTAQFVCVIAVALPGDVLGLFEGVTHGEIGYEPKGTNGFGYDPLFIKQDYGKTFAELPLDVKNRISHRARAFEKAAAIIERYIERLRVPNAPDSR